MSFFKITSKLYIFLSDIFRIKKGVVPILLLALLPLDSFASGSDSCLLAVTFSLYSFLPVLLVALAAIVALILVRKRYVNRLNNLRFLFSNISKLFRKPISNIVSPLRTLSDSEEFSAEHKSLFSFMLGNGSRLLRFSDIIADIGADSKHRNALVAEKTDLVSFVSDICTSFEPVADKQGVSLKFDAHVLSFNSYIDREKIDAALFILLSESIAYVPHTKFVTVSLDAQGNDILIKLIESESGFDLEQVSKVIENPSYDNKSLNLSTEYACIWFLNSIVKMHHGSVNVSRNGDSGIVFSITLTPGNEFKSDIQTNSFEHLKPVVLPKTKNSLRVSGDGKEGGTETVLIIDSDNSILNYMSALLSPLYNVETASTGKTGLDKALATLPDLVVTEINMPKMDGLTMCRHLKDNFETCHIPVIVLSVNDSLQSRIESAESGVDLFIAKPFDFKYLSLMVNKLIEQRKTLKNKFSNNILIPEGRIATISERDLLKRVTMVINKRMSDPNLNVETLSDEIGMSRGHFQRKFKSLTGQNPNEFIRITRLNTAAELLLNKDISIKEIADITGFGSQSYFCTLFLKQFNISPKQYRSQGRSSD